ncbi:hypothetical protein CCAX7_41040 [Capsulimonas corticalis]|uniref:Uncharacterized protein n=1 Tax=Capsulimonas corticalis TaxID=2219043 RepID=A0A402D691_9BACT|nr:RICIN domain-containing protein [Capsulimonas corticalis]BDI32053.1 hypothetical protein CCAX7_41040 [Capsulimonas corticalis]
MPLGIQGRSNIAGAAAGILLGLCGASAATAAAPTTASGWTQLFQNQSSAVWDGSDQDFSYLASNGVTYWSFGDTVLGTNNAGGGLNGGWTMVANTLLMEKNGALSAATSTYPSVPNNADGKSYWADGVFEANGYLYCLSQKRDNAGACYGMELAKFQFQPNGTLTFLGMINTPSTGVAATNGDYGPATCQFSSDTVVADGYVYVFGVGNVNNIYSPRECYVARIPASSIENSAAWTFWNGSSWVTGSMSQCAPILPDGITSAKRIGGKWVLIHKPFGPYGSDVYAEVGPSPIGPWTQYDLFQSPAVSGQPTGGNYDTYYPQLHPEKPLASGKLLVSIARAGATWNDEIANAGLYKPQFYEISLPGVLTTGTVHQVAPKNAPGSRLEEYGTSQTSGTSTDIWSSNNNANQKWAFNWVGPDLWELTPQSAPALRLNVTGSGNANGVKTQVSTANGASSQRWNIVDQGSGYTALFPLCAPGKALDLDSGTSANGTSVQIWGYLPGWSEQLWQIF